MKRKDIYNIIYMLTLIFLTLFVFYQIMHKVLGGSWITESLTLTLVTILFINTLQTARQLAKVETELKFLSRDYRSFKKEMLEFREETNSNFTKLFNILE